MHFAQENLFLPQRFVDLAFGLFGFGDVAQRNGHFISERRHLALDHAPSEVPLVDFAVILEGLLGSDDRGVGLKRAVRPDIGEDLADEAPQRVGSRDAEELFGSGVQIDTYEIE